MIELNEVKFQAGQPVDGYGPGFFRLGAQAHHGPLAILPGGVVDWAGFPDIDLFLEAAGSFDILLVGMGAEIAPLPADLRARFDAANVGVEVMGTPPACRTYNVLLAEERRVALAVLPV
ncbi:MAG: Mth938-like domain-containing protein [Pseudomonadota bacterium]